MIRLNPSAVILGPYFAGELLGTASACTLAMAASAQE